MNQEVKLLIFEQIFTNGGKIDLGEDDEFERTLSVDDSVEAAAKREFIEETEYNGDIKLIPAYVYRDGSFAYHNFFGLVDYEFEPELNWETQSYKWMTYEELKALPKKHFGLVALLKNSSKELEALLSQKKGSTLSAPFLIK